MPLQHRNDYVWSGAIKKIYPVTVKEWTNKEGQLVEWRERVVVVTNKYSRSGYWNVTDGVFTCSGKALEALESMRPGLEVILSFSFKTVVWTPKDEVEEKYWMTASCWNIVSPTERVMTEKWWGYQNRQRSTSSKKELENEESSSLLTKKDFKQRNPSTNGYDVNNYDTRKDYSNKEKEEDAPY